MLSDWNEFFEGVKAKPYSKTLKSFLDEEYREFVVYPPREKMFAAFDNLSPSSLKAVIIGQDPYHNPGQAMGLSFSVPEGVPLPPSLKNVYKEIENDLNIKMNFNNGDLTPWAKQGVLLLNAYLSVRAGKPLSHKRLEYDEFMEDAMEYIDKLEQPIVFLLWGNFAKRYKKMIHNPKHLIIESSHPSPLALSHGGWFGMHSFSKTNEFLVANGIDPIDWKIE